MPPAQTVPGNQPSWPVPPKRQGPHGVEAGLWRAYATPVGEAGMARTADGDPRYD